MLPLPVEIGAPAKFIGWRDHQPDAILRVLDTPHRFIAMVLPTGAGKSLTVVSTSLLTGWRTAFLTSTKLLQEQYSSDFSVTGLVDVRGLNAYPCVAFKDEFAHFAEHGRAQSCDEGPCHSGHHCNRRPTRSNPDATGCQYYDAVKAARDSKLVVTNYKFWLSQYYFGQGLGAFDCIVCDEGHGIPGELADFLSTELTYKDIEGTLQVRVPKGDVAAWGVWAKRESGKVERQLEDWRPHSKFEMARYRALKTVARKLKILGTMTGADWVMTEGEGVWNFDPIWVKDHGETLFRNIKKVICTSATFSKKTADMIGIPDGDVEWHEAPSDFPVSRRPVYYVPTVKVDAKTDLAAERLWVSRIDQIIRARQDRKGIIHTVSFKRRDRIMELSEFRSSMITHDSRSTRQQVEAFRAAPAGAILISPSVTTGYDFPMRECEYQIITKIPFPDTRSPIVAARTAVDKEYGHYLAMQELVQAVGRGMRSADDQCESLIVDSNCEWFIRRYRKLAPTWFLEAYKQIGTIPVPPPALED